MNALRGLANLPPEELKRKGLEFTPAEILQQPLVWEEVARVAKERRQEFVSLLKKDLPDQRTLLLAGAGSSEFIGTAVAPALRRSLQLPVVSIPSTHLVTHPGDVFLPGQRYALVHFSRSGQSPESMGTWKIAEQVSPPVLQLVITCNPAGNLAQATATNGPSRAIVLPEETNDRSLVMTSSFSSMALAAIGLTWTRSDEGLNSLVDRLAAGAERILSDYSDSIEDFTTRTPFRRACFLGSSALFGTMQECQLKMLEMTDGIVASRFESFLGLRHGPQVFVNKECAVIAALSSEPHARRYELDMLEQLHAKEQGCATLIICDQSDPRIRRLSASVIELYPEGEPVQDVYRVMTDVVVGQILGLFKSLQLGLKPDSPSRTGTIHRVVEGVRIYS